MGCDIHLFIEYKVGDKPWQTDSHHICEDNYLRDVSVSYRNYRLFGALAGIRNRVDYGAEAKGLPDDVSNSIKEESDRWDYDGHGHSYSSLEEFKQALKLSESFEDKDIEPIAFYDMYSNITQEYGYTNLLAYCEKQIKEFQIELEVEKHLLGQDINTDVQCRLVYFFDN